MVEFSVPPGSFDLGGIDGFSSDVEVRVEQLVPVGDCVMPFSWVSGNTELFEKKLEEAGTPYSVVVEDSEKERKLFRLEWNADDYELIQAMIRSNGAVLSAVWAHGEWSFQVRFRDRKSLSEFHRDCADNNVPMKVTRIYNPIDVSGDMNSGMTTTQMETVLDAFEAGYFEIPRETTLVELSEKYGVSDQAVSERLRRGITELVQSGLVTGEKELRINEAEGDTGSRPRTDSKNG